MALKGRQRRLPHHRPHRRTPRPGRHPLGLVRRRLTDKIPPRIPTTPSTASGTPAPPHRILMECTDCGRPGQPEALPDGLCRPCRTTHHPDTDETPAPPAEAAQIKARMTNLRGLLKTV